MEDSALAARQRLELWCGCPRKVWVAFRAWAYLRAGGFCAGPWGPAGKMTAMTSVEQAFVQGTRELQSTVCNRLLLSEALFLAEF